MHQPRSTVRHGLRQLVADRQRPLGERLHRFVALAFPEVTLPATVWFLFTNRAAHPGYAMTSPRLFRLARRLYANTTRVLTGTSYRAHLGMLAKLLEVPPEADGVVVECGCYLGGSTANLPLICEAVGR